MNNELGTRIIEFLKTPAATLQNRLIRGLYTYKGSRAPGELNVSFRMERFLELQREKGIDYSIPLATFSGDFGWGLNSVISELRAGLMAKEEFREARFTYLKPGKNPTPDFKIALTGGEQFAEVKSVEDASLFDIFLDKIEATAIVAPAFKGNYFLSERFYFSDPSQRARDLAPRMEDEIDRILNWLEPKLVTSSVEITREDLDLEFVEGMVWQPGPRVALAVTPETPLEEMESNARCCDRLSRGILSRLVNQVTQAYWKLRAFRGATPNSDHIYLDIDFGCPPFEEEIREKVCGILDLWGISSRVKIHFV